MEVKVAISRADLLWMNILMAHRIPSNWSLLFFLWLGMSGMYFYRKGFAQGIPAIGEQLFHNALISMVVVVSLLILNVALVVAFSTKKAGVLGGHVYTLQEDGLREVTEANDTLIKWPSIQAVFKTKDFLFVRINWYQFHIIPARCFSSREEFEGFYSELQRRIG